MVLQRAPIRSRLFGTAAPGASLLVELAKAGGGVVAAVPVHANAAGEWAGLLPPLPAGGPFNITLSDVATTAAAAPPSTPSTPRVLQTLGDVLIGDVFVCSGQSNMQEPVSVVNNASAELAAAAAYPWIRIAAVTESHSSVPLRDLALVAPGWRQASSAALGGNNGHSWGFFSATCWFTARELARTLGPGVPLGLIGTYVGGTPIEDWTPPAGELYNAMVAPLTGLAIRAILWYVTLSMQPVCQHQAVMGVARACSASIFGCVWGTHERPLSNTHTHIHTYTS